jgi:hypothetical protein
MESCFAFQTRRAEPAGRPIIHLPWWRHLLDAKKKASDLGELFFVLAFVERTNKNKIKALRTSCLHAFPDEMSVYSSTPSNRSKNICSNLIISA